MDFHQLRIFIEVARQKNFSKAADSIYLTQPTVSSHIKALEEEIGVLLFDRTQRELQLTQAGKILFQYAQQLLSIKEEAFFAVQQEYQSIKGHLELAASSVPGAYILPPLMKGFLTKHPDVTFAIVLRDSQQIHENVRDYTYNLGFVGEATKSDALEEIELLQDDLVLIAAPEINLPGEKPPSQELECFKPQIYEYDLHAANNSTAFLQLPFILREPGSATRMVFENALQKFYGDPKIDLNVLAYLENQEAIKEAVKNGLGLTMISLHAVNDEIQAGLLKAYRIPALQIHRNFYLIYHKNRVFSPLYNAFLQYCIGYFISI